MAIAAAKFGGIIPGTSARLLPAANGTVAHNVRLIDGSLQPEPAPGLVRTEAYEIKDIYVPAAGECCAAPLTFPHCASVTEPADPGACCGFDHVVVWDHCNGYYRQDRCGTTKYPLVVDAPTKTLVATLTGQGTTTVADARSYTYTWVDQFGTESQPAPPTAPVQARDGDVFELSNFGDPPANAVAVRIYRTSSEFEGFKSASKDTTQPVGTTFQLVEELTLPLAGGTYTDTRRLKDIEFGTLTTHEQCPPPGCMDQVVLTDQGYHVGFHGNELYVSERNEPGNWPQKYQVTLPDKIVAIVAHHDVVLVGTTGQPYRVSIGFKPDRDQADAEVTPVPLDGMYPCLQRQTMVATEFGALYVSHLGLIEVRAVGTTVAKNVTEDLIGRQEWPKVAPNIAAWYNGAYYGVRAPSGKGFRLEFPTMRDRAGSTTSFDMTAGVTQHGVQLTTFDMPAAVIHAGRDGWLYCASGKELHRWAAGPAKMTYRWRSKVFQFWRLDRLGAVQILGDFGKPLEFRLMSAGTLVYSRTVNSSAPFRLPAHCARYEWQFELSGTTRVFAVKAAATIEELSNVERPAGGSAQAALE